MSFKLLRLIIIGCLVSLLRMIAFFRISQDQLSLLQERREVPFLKARRVSPHEGAQLPGSQELPPTHSLDDFPKLGGQEILVLPGRLPDFQQFRVSVRS